MITPLAKELELEMTKSYLDKSNDSIAEGKIGAKNLTIDLIHRGKVLTKLALILLSGKTLDTLD